MFLTVWQVVSVRCKKGTNVLMWDFKSVKTALKLYKYIYIYIRRETNCCCHARLMEFFPPLLFHIWKHCITPDKRLSRHSCNSTSQSGLQAVSSALPEGTGRKQTDIKRKNSFHRFDRLVKINIWVSCCVFIELFRMFLFSTVNVNACKQICALQNGHGLFL